MPVVVDSEEVEIKLIHLIVHFQLILVSFYILLRKTHRLHVNPQAVAVECLINKQSCDAM